MNGLGWQQLSGKVGQTNERRGRCCQLASLSTYGTTLSGGGTKSKMSGRLQSTRLCLRGCISTGHHVHHTMLKLVPCDCSVSPPREIQTHHGPKNVEEEDG